MAAAKTRLARINQKHAAIILCQYFLAKIPLANQRANTATGVSKRIKIVKTIARITFSAVGPIDSGGGGVIGTMERNRSIIGRSNGNVTTKPNTNSQIKPNVFIRKLARLMLTDLVLFLSGTELEFGGMEFGGIFMRCFCA